MEFRRTNEPISLFGPITVYICNHYQLHHKGFNDIVVVSTHHDGKSDIENRSLESTRNCDHK